MIKLPWKDGSSIDRHVIRTYVDTMIKRSEMSDVFAILMPVPVYEHIKNVGINAELVELPEFGGSDMIWIKVNKIRKTEKQCGKDEPCFEKGYCWGHLARLVCKYVVEEKDRNSFFCKKTKERIKNNNIYFEKPTLCKKKMPDIHARLVADALNYLFCGQFFSADEKNEEYNE